MFGSKKNRKPRGPRRPKRRGPLHFLFVTAKEVKALFNCCERTAHRLLKKAREKAGKVKGQYVTVSDISDVSGVPKRALQTYLKRLFKPKHS